MRQTILRREGDESLNARKEAETRPVTDPDKQDKPKARSRKSSGSDDLGRALRTVYDETVREDVPDDFLDLLGKLN